jgi:hypothetical protein
MSSVEREEVDPYDAPSLVAPWRRCLAARAHLAEGRGRRMNARTHDGVWLRLAERAADASDGLARERDPAERRRVARTLAREVRLELEALTTHEADAARRAFAAIGAALEVP